MGTMGHYDGNPACFRGDGGGWPDVRRGSASFDFRGEGTMREAQTHRRQNQPEIGTPPDVCGLSEWRGKEARTIRDRWRPGPGEDRIRLAWRGNGSRSANLQATEPAGNRPPGYIRFDWMARKKRLRCPGIDGAQGLVEAGFDCRGAGTVRKTQNRR